MKKSGKKVTPTKIIEKKKKKKKKNLDKLENHDPLFFFFSSQRVEVAEKPSSLKFKGKHSNSTPRRNGIHELTLL